MKHKHFNVRKTTLYILYLFTFLMLVMHQATSQDALKKPPIIRNYGASVLGSPINYSGIVLPDKQLLFANGKGALLYNGTHWNLLKLAGQSEAVSLLYQDSVIYVGGNDEFGYFKKGDSDKYVYTSFKNYYSRMLPLGKIFQVIAYKGNIYFQTYGAIYQWDGAKLHEIPLHDAYIFNTGPALVASIFNTGLAVLEQDTFKLVNTRFKFAEDAAFDIFPTSQPGHYQLITGENGIFDFNLYTYSVKPIHSEVSKLFKNDGFYHGVPYLDSLWVATTWDGGVVIYNSQGKIKRFINNEVGITGKFLRELFVDYRNKIWVTSDVGISEIYWPAFDTLTQANLTVSSIKINDQEANIALLKDSLLKEGTNLTFELATPGFNWDEVAYSYKLEGISAKWSDWVQYNHKDLTDLKGGSYTLFIKAKTVTGIETTPLKLSFTIQTPWYKSVVGIIVLVAGLVVITLLLIWARTLRLNIINKRLEYTVNKRTRELIEKSEALARANKELQTKNKELDQFVYRSSHDLIAPLKSLKGLIYIAKNDRPTKNQEEYLNHMEKSVLRLEDFINSIIDFTTNVNTPPVRKEVAVDEIINDLVLELKYFAQAENVKLIRNLNLPVIKCDPKRLKIILSNLITNCVKYHNYNQPNPYIEIRTFEKNNQAIIEVEDNGQGIKPELLTHIFDMFFRASDTSEGSGLGLYIVKDTVAKIGGIINVNSVFGRGTTFTIILQHEKN